MLSLPYQNARLCRLTKELVLAVYALTHDLPEGEGLRRQLRQDGLTAYVQTAAGCCAGKRRRRRRALREARSAVERLDAALALLAALDLTPPDGLTPFRELLPACHRALRKAAKQKK